jgi:hypothetical protein
MPNFSFNIDIIRAALGSQVADEFVKIQNALNLVAKQTNANPLGDVPAPPQISAVNVQVAQGVHDVQIQDNSPVQRGVHYFLEYSNSPNFSGPSTKTLSLGPSKNTRIFLGNGTVYWRGYSSYPTSSPSAPVYSGTETQPTPATGGGAISGPVGLPGAGSGTEPSTFSKPGAGFGFDPDRSPLRELD